METQMRKFTATVARAMVVTSVWAESIEEAKKEIERQLSKPGREQIKREWIAYGKTVREW